MADEERLLAAYIEFVAKGQSQIIRTADQIEQALKNKDFSKAATIIFRARGESGGSPAEEARKATEAISQNLTNFAKGTSLRRVIASSLHDAFSEGGTSIGEALLAGIAGVLAGSTLMRLGWKAGDLLMGIPGFIGQTGRDLQSYHLERAMDDWRHQREQPNEPEDVRKALDIGARRMQHQTWHDTTLTYKSIHAASEELRHEAGMTRNEAQDVTDQLGILALTSVGGAKEKQSRFSQLISRYTDLRRSGDIKGFKSFVEGEPEIRNSVREYWQQQHHGIKGVEGDVPFRRFLDSERFTPQMLDKVISYSAYKARDVLGIDQKSNFNKPIFPEGSPDWVTNPHEFQKYYLQSRGMLHLADPGDIKKRTLQQPYLGPSHIPGLQTGELPGIDEERKNVPGKFYSFTSLSGLAEQMQLMFSGSDTAEEQLSTLRQIETNTRPSTHGGASNHPASR